MTTKRENPLRALKKALKGRDIQIAVAESCTGGLLGSLITGSPGSSAYFAGGVIAYSNDVKKALLGVSAATLERYGAVSTHTAKEMAEGVKSRLKSDVAVSITGVAGPGGGTIRKPVGTVYIGVSTAGGTRAKKFMFEGGRATIRRASALAALKMLTTTIEKLKQ